MKSASAPESTAPTQATLDAKFFQGLSDPTRIEILELLLSGEKNVSEIVSAIGGSQSRVSNHLACLRWCGFVTTRREGLFVYYYICDPRVREILRLGQEVAREHEEGLLTCVRLPSPSKGELAYPEAAENEKDIQHVPVSQTK